jgi:hypothetical protein
MSCHPGNHLHPAAAPIEPTGSLGTPSPDKEAAT